MAVQIISFGNKETDLARKCKMSIPRGICTENVLCTISL